jgi:hypothetical protein
MQVTALGSGDEALRHAAQLLGFRLSCADSLVAKEIRRLIPQQCLAVTIWSPQLSLSNLMAHWCVLPLVLAWIGRGS